MKKYTRPVITLTYVNIEGALLGNSQVNPAGGTGGGNKGTYSGSGQEAKSGFTPVSEDNASSLWED